MQPLVSEERPIIFSLHGIRTRGAWQKADLTRVLSEAGFDHLALDFGFFRALRLLRPAVRRRQVDWFRDRYTAEMRGRSSLPSVIAHSFGTYIVAEAMRIYPEVCFSQIILCGSIVRQDFPWSKLTDAGQVWRVLNDFGRRDFWAGIVVWVVGDAGSSGVEGFSDTAGGRVIQRSHPDWRHSDFFYELNYRRNWTHFLQGNSPGPPGTAAGGTTNWRFRLAVLTCLVVLLCLVGLAIRGSRLWSGIRHHPSPPVSSLQPLPTPATVSVALPVECSQPESSPHWRFASEDEIREYITGQWLSCNTMGLWETLESKDQVGIEFTPSGRWFTLLRDASGTVVRGNGFDYEGTFQVIDTSMMNGPGIYQVNITGARGRLEIVSPAFSDSPRKMLLRGFRRTVTYVPAPLRRP
jgi:hypothetical protein